MLRSSAEVCSIKTCTRESNCIYLMSGGWIEIYMIIHSERMNFIFIRMLKTYIAISAHFIKAAQTEIKI